MLRVFGRAVRALFAPGGGGTLTGSSSQPGGRRMRRVVLLLGALVVVAAGAGAYYFYFREPPPLAETPRFADAGDRLPTQEEFEELARTDPVKLLAACLTRYQREVKNGITATLVKKERVNGDPRPPKEPAEELIQLSVKGDVPGADGKRKAHVRMVWAAGARKNFVGTVHGSLLVEEKGGNDDKITAWLGFAFPAPLNGPMARGASRYCMKDAGLYGAMLRSHTVWKKRQDDKELHWRFVERRVVPEVGGRDCLVVERTCPSPEVDPFEIGGEPNLGGKTPEEVGSVRVRLFIDAERWLQVGSELHRADGNLLGSYYFRDINLNPTFADDTFTTEGLKKAVAEVKK
jgi:hypothetical protein